MFDTINCQVWVGRSESELFDALTEIYTAPNITPLYGDLGGQLRSFYKETVKQKEVDSINSDLFIRHLTTAFGIFCAGAHAMTISIAIEVIPIIISKLVTDEDDKKQKAESASNACLRIINRAINLMPRRA